MNYRTLLGIPVALVLALTSIAPISGHAQHRQGADRLDRPDRDRAFDRDRAEIREQPRDWDRLNRRDLSGLKDRDIYGHEFMTADECQQYRERLGNIDTSESWQKFQMLHEELMRKRALAQGGDLVPPGQGAVYGGELMTVQERNKYRELLRLLDAGKARHQFLARHRDRMDERALALDYKLKETK